MSTKFLGQLPFSKESNNSSVAPKILLLGNSHARHFLPMLEFFSENNEYSLFYNEFDTQKPIGEQNLLESLILLNTTLSPNDIVVISSAFYTEDDSIVSSAKDELIRQWDITLSSLAEHSTNSPRFIFFVNSPRFAGSMPYFPLCYQEFFRLTLETVY